MSKFGESEHRETEAGEHDENISGTYWSEPPTNSFTPVNRPVTTTQYVIPTHTIQRRISSDSWFEISYKNNVRSLGPKMSYVAPWALKGRTKTTLIVSQSDDGSRLSWKDALPGASVSKRRRLSSKPTITSRGTEMIEIKTKDVSGGAIRANDQEKVKTAHLPISTYSKVKKTVRSKTAALNSRGDQTSPFRAPTVTKPLSLEKVQQKATQETQACRTEQVVPIPGLIQGQENCRVLPSEMAKESHPPLVSKHQPCRTTEEAVKIKSKRTSLSQTTLGKLLSFTYKSSNPPQYLISEVFAPVGPQPYSPTKEIRSQQPESLLKFSDRGFCLSDDFISPENHGNDAKEQQSFTHHNSKANINSNYQLPPNTGSISFELSPWSVQNTSDLDLIDVNQHTGFEKTLKAEQLKDREDGYYPNTTTPSSPLGGGTFHLEAETIGEKLKVQITPALDLEESNSSEMRALAQIMQRIDRMPSNENLESRLGESDVEAVAQLDKLDTEWLNMDVYVQREKTNSILDDNSPPTAHDSADIQLPTQRDDDDPSNEVVNTVMPATEASEPDEFDEGLDDHELLEIVPEDLLTDTLIHSRGEIAPCRTDAHSVCISNGKYQNHNTQRLSIFSRHLSSTPDVGSDGEDEFPIDDSDEEAMLKLPESVEYTLCSGRSPSTSRNSTDPRLSSDEAYNVNPQPSPAKLAYPQQVLDKNPTNRAYFHGVQSSPSESSKSGSDCSTEVEEWAHRCSSNQRQIANFRQGVAPQAIDESRVAMFEHTSPGMTATQYAKATSPVPHRRTSKVSASHNLDPEYEPLQTFARPDFPQLIRDRSPVLGLSPQNFLRTCFKIGEMFKEGKRCNSFGQVAIVELFARVAFSFREPGTTRQCFVFMDLWRDNPPFPEGILMNYLTTGLADTESNAFVDAGGKKLARCVGRLKRDAKNATGWLLHIIAVRETDWEEIRYTKRIVSADGVKSEVI